MGKVDKRFLVENIQAWGGNVTEERLVEADKLYEDLGREMNKENI